MLDDFKTALDTLKQYKLQMIGGTVSDSGLGDDIYTDQARKKRFDRPSDHVERRSRPSAQQDGQIDFETALRMDSGQLRDLGEAEKA